MTKITLGVSTYVQWIPSFMVGGYTQDSLCAHLAAQGVQTVTIRWGESDHPSYVPRGEPRPGEFYWGNEPVTRDGNDDITSALYTSAQVAPADAPMRELLDACATHGLRVVFQLGRWTAFTTSWDYNAYKQGRLTPGGTPSAAGVAGWLTSKRKFFSDATARAYYKNRLDAFVNSFGGHSAIWCLDLGNEYTHVYNWDDDPWENTVFFPWVEEMSDYLWNALPGSATDKPFITISEYRAHRPNDNINNVMNYFTSVPDDKVMITWHNYNRDKTLTQIRDAIYTAQDRYPDYTIRVGENWPWYVGPAAVPDSIADINIPPEAYNGGFAPDSTPPYEHERMYCFLMAATAKAADYTRWCKYVDGSGAACVSTIPRMGEILKPAQDIAETIDLGDDPVRWTDHISSSGTLDFVAAAQGGDARFVPFVLVGSGVQTVDFGLAGASWQLTTYAWDSPAGATVADRASVDPRSCLIDFGDYTRGFCAGYLECLDEPPVHGDPPAEPPLPIAITGAGGATAYQVWLRNWDGERIALFTGTGRETGGLRRFSFLKLLRKPGQYILELDGSDARIDSFVLDYQVEFWRRDQYGGLDWYKAFEAFHRADAYRQDETGQDIYESRGQHYNVLLLAEPIFYDAGTAYTTKSGPAETVAKAFVNENIGPAATAPPRDYAGVMPGLTIEANAATGANWSGGRARQNLLDVLVELAEYAPADFMVEGTGAAAFEFRWRANQWGDDKTWGNAAGIPAVVFDGQLGNARNVIYEYDRKNEINVCHVLGQGSGEERRIVTRASGAGEDSPWNQRAVCRDARNTYSTEALNRKGDEVLDKMRSRVATQIDVAQTPATRFGRDWDIGDLVTVRYRAFEVTQKIIGVRVDVGQDGAETIQAMMQEP